MRLRAALALLLCVALPACGDGGSRISASDLPGLVLEPSDLPPRFHRFDVGKQAQADLAAPRDDPARFGREGGWKARYKRSGTTAAAGPLVVESRADLFRSPGGARKDLTAYESQFGESPGSAVPTRLLKGLGDDAHALTFRQGSGTVAVRFFAIAWRRENATASVTVQGFEGKVALRDALELARKQDRRIARAA